MIAVLQSSARHGVLAVLIPVLMNAPAGGETIEFTWTSAGTFNGLPSSGVVVTAFSSSAPWSLVEFRSSYTGQQGGTRLFGPFEITAESADKLFGNYDIVGSGPIRQGMNIGSGSFTITGGTGQFAGTTGQGTMEVITTLTSFPTTTGTVEQQWWGTLTLLPPTLPGDYNQNGSVDAADYVAWRNTRGMTAAGLAADGDGNGMVDQADYDVWRANFGATTRMAANLVNDQVPEPRSLVFATILLVLFVVMPKRDRTF
jgi:hypothetical protein